jgi:hypothetical protein
VDTELKKVDLFVLSELNLQFKGSFTTNDSFESHLLQGLIVKVKEIFS